MGVDHKEAPTNSVDFMLARALGGTNWYASKKFKYGKFEK
jgi:hypothetical protein